MNTKNTGKRTRRTGSQYDTNTATSNSYSEFAGGLKTLPTGWARDAAGTQLHDATTAKAIKPGTNVAVFNNSATVAFIAFYPTGSAVTADATNGVPVPPNSYIFLNSHNNDNVIASAATVLIYPMIDETNYQSPS